MSDTVQSFEASQSEAVKLLSYICAAIAVAMIVFVGTQNGNLMLALAGGTFFAGLGFVARRLRPGLDRIIMAQALVGVAISFNAALTGHPMQIDSHMLYFAVLALVVTMTGIRSLLLAAGTIAVHHLVLTIALPSLVYSSTELGFNLMRTTFHAVIVIMETLALGYMVRKRLHINELVEQGQIASHEATERAQAALEKATAENARAETALSEAREATEAAAQAHAMSQEALQTNQRAQADREARQRDEEAAREKRDEALATLLDVFEKHLDQLASGDLSTRVTEKIDPDYESLRNSFNATTQRLSSAIQQVREQSYSMQSQSQEISTSANDLSQRTEQQAATLAEIARSVDELATSLESVAGGSTEAEKLAEETALQATEGSDIMREAVAAMRNIESGSQEINKITSVIEDIAFQTNLLALNAGVEAARAGEAGRGFAVVASEVRALAQRSSDAAREINLLLERSSKQIASGADLVDRTGTALGGIRTSVEQITTRLRASSRATADQSENLALVNRSISALESVTQKNAAMFEQTTAANVLLSEGARALTGLVDTFVTGGHEIDTHSNKLRHAS
ncbi:methyl-accepting chemotaxis protein [Celeribacter arenosi]|uniref:Methyl-accepting chemotaxis protein n=1 Tax=Celeribacter arenosi TaxID=792649 RepID=A0ABP7JSQ0_9RHOB